MPSEAENNRSVCSHYNLPPHCLRWREKAIVCVCFSKNVLLMVNSVTPKMSQPAQHIFRFGFSWQAHGAQSHRIDEISSDDASTHARRWLPIISEQNASKFEHTEYWNWWLLAYEFAPVIGNFQLHLNIFDSQNKSNQNKQTNKCSEEIFFFLLTPFTLSISNKYNPRAIEITATIFHIFSRCCVKILQSFWMTYA